MTGWLMVFCVMAAILQMINGSNIEMEPISMICKVPGSKNLLPVQELNEQECNDITDAVVSRRHHQTYRRLPTRHHSSKSKIKWKVTEHGNQMFVVSRNVKSNNDFVKLNCCLVIIEGRNFRKEQKSIRCSYSADGSRSSVSVIPVTRTITQGGESLLQSIYSRHTRASGTIKDGHVAKQRCYNWRPQKISMDVHQNNLTYAINVTWLPAFVAGTLEIFLYDKFDTFIDYHKIPSYEAKEKNITNHVFENLGQGSYLVSINPVGCRDCPWSPHEECHADPTQTNLVYLGPGRLPPPSVVVEEDPQSEADVYYFITGVVVVAMIFLLTAGVLWLRSRSSANKLISVEEAAGYTKVHNYSDISYSHVELCKAPAASRIVLLYGVDHPLHIRAVSRFAEMLRTLLGVEVVLEREQGREATRNITSWMMDNLKPPTAVIVIMSEGLYQLFASYDCGASEPSSRLRLNTFAEFGPKSLSYLRDHCLDGKRAQMVLPVSFGYSHGDKSHNKLVQSNPVLFNGAHFTITDKDEFGVRTLDIEGLLTAIRCQDAASGKATIPEIREFLVSVDEMDAHINKYGPLCWEHDTVGTMDGGSSSTRSSILTMNYSGRRCHETSSRGNISDTNEIYSLSSRSCSASESSCITVLIPEDGVEPIVTISTPERKFIEESPPYTGLAETQQGESSPDQTEGRDC